MCQCWHDRLDCAEIVIIRVFTDDCRRLRLIVTVIAFLLCAFLKHTWHQLKAINVTKYGMSSWLSIDVERY